MTRLSQKNSIEVKLRQFPAIALTTYAGEFDRQQARASGFQRHLAKLVEPTDIIAVVANLCGQRR